VRTTTLGFGADFNEDLLTAVADEAGGNFYFIDSPDKAPAVFLEELGELTSVVGQNLEVVLSCEPGVSVETSYSKFPGVVGPREAVWRLGDLYADDVRLLLVSVRVPAGFPAGRSPVAQVGVRYHQVLDGVGERRHELPAMLAFADELQAGADPHPEVLREQLVMSAARAKEQAIAQADRGEFAEAQATLLRCTGTIRSRLSEPSGLAEADQALLGAEAGLCDELMAGFSRDRYDTSSRKKAIQQAFLAKKQRGLYRKGS
jgi:Ca-activated chloride channel family protein